MARLGRSLVRGTLPLREIGERLGRSSAEAGRGRLGMQVGIFLVIGVCSTMAYALLYLALRPAMTPWWANFTALLLTAIANTAANRRFTFGVRGPRDVVRHQVQGLAIFGTGLAATSGSLWVLHALMTPSRALEVAVLTAANLAVTVLRFVALKLWVFAREDLRRGPAEPGSPAASRTGSAAAPPG
jgi:putative flippase GtrA